MLAFLDMVINRIILKSTVESLRCFPTHSLGPIPVQPPTQNPTSLLFRPNERVNAGADEIGRKWRLCGATLKSKIRRQEFGFSADPSFCSAAEAAFGRCGKRRRRFWKRRGRGFFVVAGYPISSNNESMPKNEIFAHFVEALSRLKRNKSHFRDLCTRREEREREKSVDRSSSSKRKERRKLIGDIEIP